MRRGTSVKEFLLCVVVGFFVVFHTTVEARALRSPAIKAQFQRQQPCPATGNTKGKFPGYVVDHVLVQDGKAKDRIEREQCRR